MKIKTTMIADPGGSSATRSSNGTGPNENEALPAPPRAGGPAQMPDYAARQQPARTLGRLNGTRVRGSQVLASLLLSLDSVPESLAEWHVLDWSDDWLLAEPTEDDVISLAALLHALVHMSPGAVGEACSSQQRQHTSKIVQEFVPPSIGHDQPRPHARLVEALTNRELEVLQLIAIGRKNREIAQDLFVTLDTVKKHISRILSKTSATNRTHAVTRARELRLIP